MDLYKRSFWRRIGPSSVTVCAAAAAADLRLVSFHIPASHGEVRQKAFEVAV